MNCADDFGIFGFNSSSLTRTSITFGEHCFSSVSIVKLNVCDELGKSGIVIKFVVFAVFVADLCAVDELFGLNAERDALALLLGLHVTGRKFFPDWWLWT